MMLGPYNDCRKILTELRSFSCVFGVEEMGCCDVWSRPGEVGVVGLVCMAGVVVMAVDGMRVVGIVEAVGPAGGVVHQEHIHQIFLLEIWWNLVASGRILASPAGARYFESLAPGRHRTGGTGDS